MEGNKVIVVDNKSIPLAERGYSFTLSSNSNTSRLANLICNFTGVSRERLLNCICRYGIDEVLSNPEVLCVPIGEQQKITELRELLLYIKEATKNPALTIRDF